MVNAALLRLIPQAPQTLRDILDGARGAVQPAIRSELFGKVRFAQHGRSLGDTHRAVNPTYLAATFFPRLRSNIQTLRLAHHYIGIQAATGYDISPAAEWLLDNFHLIEAQLKEIHDGLPRSYFRALPVLQDEPLAGLPRIYGMAWAFVAHTDGAFDDDLLVHFLCAYQECRELNLSEIWALPTTLRVVLVENLRRLAERVATNKAAREVANLCCDNIETYSLQTLNELLAQMNRRGVGRVFLAQMAQRLQDRRRATEAGDPSRYLTWLHHALPDAAQAQMQQGADQTADNLSVSNAVKSLRAIGDADWPEIIERSSTLMQHMLTSNTFEAEHSLTRDQTLHGIERLAQRGGRSEDQVARALLSLMQVNEHPVDPGLPRDTQAASYWLFGRGRPGLLRALDLTDHPAIRAMNWWRERMPRLVMPLYLLSLLAGTLGLVAWMLVRHATDTHGALLSSWLAWAVAGLMLFPASETMVALVNRLISESARPKHLPRLALAGGIGPENRVMVVIPCMLTHAASIQELVHRLHLHYLANPEPSAQFALLSDWADADAATLETDGPLLVMACQQLSALNLLYPALPEAGPRFILLHRQRLFSQSERRWIGWERKRGKLELLLTHLATGPGTAFLDLGRESVINAHTQYVVTLDSDTQLPPGRLRELVGVAAHPHNRPVLDASGRNVISGYGILQPRVITPLPVARDFTLYHWLFAGQCGIDPYSAATSEVYQDLFSEGTFTGKGLLHVQAMHAVLSGRLPDGQVLSHDLLEGALMRCAAVTDITVIEDAPFHADVAASRVHRWTRGDWQLLPFLLNASRFRLRAVNRWKMFDNLRRSLVPPMSLLLLLVAVQGTVVSAWAALALVTAAFLVGPLMGAVAGFSPSRDDVAKLHFYRLATTDMARALWGGLWHIAQLLAHSLASVDAITRALYRMLVSHHLLLQWTTAASAQAAAKGGLQSLLLQHWKVPAAAVALLLGLWVLGASSPWLAFGLVLLWASSPVLTWLVSRVHPSRDGPALSIDDQAYLEGLARDTWRLFERCVNEQESHLPPDNLQTLPHDMVAHRTSPTNMGLYLLSVACARSFGWIDTAQLMSRLEATLATMARLQRHRGHFLNWYDTQTCAPLMPMYVSTVDSGNLSGHLLAVAQACLELAVQHAREEPLLGSSDDTVQRLRAVAERCEELAWGSDFGFLYHRKRHLFHIGYRVAEQQLDAGFYDLLASESRLTSLLAIAKGDVPARHWASLGRPFFAVGSVAGLRSWAGSMFEYLMPSLVLDEPHGSVLRDACRAALCEQVAFARLKGVPWGISESAYAGRDQTLAYQYAPQGVPRLALRRTPPEELVIAPYATGLACLIAPAQACRNFEALEALAARENYGFIEALDYSPGRQAAGELHTPVSTFMAHHQGMTIVALANVLRDGVAQRWGMGHPRIEAVASLLHERVPREISVLQAPPGGPQFQSMRRRAPGLLRDVAPGATAVEPTHVLSNGRYSVALRANGAGWSRWAGVGITRWRDDALRDAHGSFFYLRWPDPDRPNGTAAPVSITQHPAPDPAAHYHSTYHADRVCFDATWPGLQTHMTVWVSPEDDIEFRQVELRNLSDKTLDIELMSAFDVTLAAPGADEAHPAFSNLFVRAQWQAEHQALVFVRTPRLATERGAQAAHFLVNTDPQTVAVRCQTDRLRWLGRNHSSSQPLASFDATEAATLSTGLDPVCAMSVQLRIVPNGKARLTFATAASYDHDTLRAVIDKYRQHSHVRRSSLMSATLTGIRMRAEHLSAENLAAIQSLTTALVLSLARANVDAVRVLGSTPLHGPAPMDTCDRRLLWRFGISGDRPVILVSAGVTQGLGLVRVLAQALGFWSRGGIGCDLVVVNAEPMSYLMPLQRDLMALRDRHMAEDAVRSSRTGPALTALHVFRIEEMSAAEMSTLQMLARIWLHADGRPLAHHVHEWCERHEQALEQRLGSSTTAIPLAAPMATSVVPSGKFDAETGEFRFNVNRRSRPVRPWVNVLANEGFGAQLSEAGGGYTWAQNSRLNQLTTWSNDPVADPPAEWFFIQDSKTREIWSLTPGTCGEPALDYRVAHGQGYSVVSHRRGDLVADATWCVDSALAVKQVGVRLTNRGQRTLRLRLVGIAEWQMGANRSDRNTVSTASHHQRLADTDTSTGPNGKAVTRKLTALLATQREQGNGFGQGTAFLAVVSRHEETPDWTCDRRELFDARGRLVLPDHMGQQQGMGLDPCAALSCHVDLLAGETLERVFLMGYAPSADAAVALAAVAAIEPAFSRLEKVRAQWDQLLGAATVLTPDPLFDALVNRWLLYQTVACRLWAKAGFYQAGGATGFRDQLQDTIALAWAAPERLRAQILLCASRQFVEGDVQHWWHAPSGAGVRTHFSDDLLWLPHACCRYLNATGDMALLDHMLPFLDAEAIPPGAEDAYTTPAISAQEASVYEHAARTIDHSLRVGAHGLPLMGTGDWNDGMNQVGHLGRGESVWLGWFLCQLVADFAPLALARGDELRAARWQAAAEGWKTALVGQAWDGQWFRRAFFDDRQALGSDANPEAKIDLIAQAWAVLSNAAPIELQGLALQAVEKHLVDPQEGLIRLLDPPLEHAIPSAGYIQAYPPGVRENGGQYSHGGVWALMAQAQYASGQPANAEANDRPYRYFTYLSAAHRASHPQYGPAYGLEPYVMAADVYSQPPYVGRGGWSWYTGAAAWMHRAAIESIFGLKLSADSLHFLPCLPSHWPQAELTLRRDGRTMRFVFTRGSAQDALTQVGVPGALALGRGEVLLWPGLAPQSTFVMALDALATVQV